MSKQRLLLPIIPLILLILALNYVKPTFNTSNTQISIDNITHHISQFSSKDNARITGFKGEQAAAKYIVSQYKSYGLDVKTQTFSVPAFMSEGAELLLETPTVREVDSRCLIFTPPTPSGGITAELVDAGLGSTFNSLNLSGKIALMQRGGDTFYNKTQGAAKAGAIGAIIFNNTPGLISGTLGKPTDIPVLIISQADGEYVRDLLKSRPIRVKMKVNSATENSHSANIIAEQKLGSNSKTIIIGAHYDSIDTPGANDNASGIATLLELARVLSSEDFAYNLRFIAFGAEEIGLIGSKHYVDSLSPTERKNIVGMINLDMVGVGNTLSIYTAGLTNHATTADIIETVAKNLNYSYKRDVLPSGDSASFESAGIDSVMLSFGPDPNYHTDRDSLDKISKDNLLEIANLLKETILTKARTQNFIP